MTTTVNLSYKELSLLCEMSSKYVDELESSMDVFNNLYDDLYEDDEKGYVKILKNKENETYELWEKLEKTKKEMIHGGNK